MPKANLSKLFFFQISNLFKKCKFITTHSFTYPNLHGKVERFESLEKPSAPIRRFTAAILNSIISNALDQLATRSQERLRRLRSEPDVSILAALVVIRFVKVEI